MASHNAGVTVVIIGIANSVGGKRTLFSINEHNEVVKKKVEYINAYLVEGDNSIVFPRQKQLSGLPEMYRGNSPTDGGHLLLEGSELVDLDLTADQSAFFIRPFVGSYELIRGAHRNCIWIEDKDIEKAMSIPSIEKRMNKVREFRLTSKKRATVAAANWPHRFDERKSLSSEPIICIPVISSESRPYLPAGILPPFTVISNKVFGMPSSQIWPLSIICSRLNLVWVANVCARMRTDYSYTNTLGWNTFPIPKLTERNKVALTACTENILLAREAHFPATIADLYDPENMPEDLRRAHERNDEVLERIYIGRRFRNDTERLEKLFDLYAQMTAKENAI